MGTTLRTVDVDTVSYRAARDAELKRVMTSIGKLLDSVPDGDPFPRERSGEIAIDPLSFDRTRPNLSYCHYRNGSWSIAGTSAYSARSYDRGISAVPLTEQWIYSSERGFFHPAESFGNGWGQRCDMDRIRVSGLDRPDSSSGSDHAGWIYSAELGVIRDGGYEERFVIPAGDYETHRNAPWAGDESQVRSWADEQTYQMTRMMASTGNALNRVPDGQSVSGAEIVDDTIMTLDPRWLDRSRHNLSYCLYRTGDWSVAATPAYSATSSIHGSGAVPLDQQFIRSSRDGLFNPTSALGMSSRPRCEQDGIPASADRVSQGWLWFRGEGAVVPNSPPHDSTWVLAESEYASYSKSPWAWEIER